MYRSLRVFDGVGGIIGILKETPAWSLAPSGSKYDICSTVEGSFVKSRSKIDELELRNRVSSDTCWWKKVSLMHSTNAWSELGIDSVSARGDSAELIDGSGFHLTFGLLKSPTITW